VPVAQLPAAAAAALFSRSVTRGVAAELQPHYNIHIHDFRTFMPHTFTANFATRDETRLRTVFATGKRYVFCRPGDYVRTTLFICSNDVRIALPLISMNEDWD
jgi:hypothetical protein